MACAPNDVGVDPRCLEGGVRTTSLTPWSCPPGWRADRDRGCVPTLRTDCPVGTGPLPDGTCTDSANCGEGVFPEAPPGVDPTRVIWVDDDAAEGGDGSRARPLRDLSEALRRAPDQSAILLAAGRYPVFAEPRRVITVRGVCAARVTLVPLATPPAPSLLHARDVDAAVTLEDLTAETDSTRLIDADQTARVTVRRVVFRARRASMAQLRSGAQGEFSHVVHRVTERGDGIGNALVDARESRARVARCTVSGAGALLANLDRVAASRVEDSAAVDAAAGIHAENASVLAVARVAVEGLGAGHGLWVRNAEADVTDLAARRCAVRASLGARFRATRLSVTDGTAEVMDPGTFATLTDVAVSWTNTAPRIASTCVDVHGLAHAQMQRVRMSRCNDAGAFVYLLGDLELDDAWIHDVQPNAQGLAGVGAAAGFGARVSLQRTVIERAGMVAVLAVNLPASLLRRLPLALALPELAEGLMREPSRVEVYDVVVRSSRRHPTAVAAALAAGANSFLTGERVSISAQEGAALVAMEAGFDRAAVVEWARHVGGGAALLVPFLPASIDGTSTVALDGVFVGAVTRAPILYDAQTRMLSDESPRAWGAYTAPGCTMTLRNGVFDGANTTTSALVSLGQLTLQRGTVTGHTGCAVLRSSAVGGQVSLDSVQMTGNARDEACVDDALPLLRLPVSPN
ncbi:MAG: hypothetical protein U0325_09245 [Polyangiales bacterium]